MSRAINLPSQSVKLTNVATVRLTLQGKRFEVACYKNKVLDYRSGLETDLSEVLQTSNIHIFTNVTKGQFASVADCSTAFGPNKTQEDMAIQILLHGKSVQVSEVERSHLYDTTLTQIATQIASTCIHPISGKPYTVSQIKHALTTTPTTNVSESEGVTTRNNNNNNNNNNNHPSTGSTNSSNDNKKKTKKNNNNHKKQQSTATTTSTTQISSSNSYHHFTIQPQKSIKQQYLQAIKYLQYNHILQIVRASMELIWYYPNMYDSMVRTILHELHIPMTDPTTTTSSSDVIATTTAFESSTSPPLNDDKEEEEDDDNHNEDRTTDTTTTTTNTMSSRTIIVDPSIYRILQDCTTTKVPDSRIEILRQQVFQTVTTTTAQSQLPVISNQSAANGRSSNHERTHKSGE
jgi:ribosome maturation protein Sdo1